MERAGTVTSVLMKVGHGAEKTGYPVPTSFIFLPSHNHLIFCNLIPLLILQGDTKNFSLDWTAQSATSELGVGGSGDGRRGKKLREELNLLKSCEFNKRSPE